MIQLGENMGKKRAGLVSFIDEHYVWRTIDLAATQEVKNLVIHGRGNGQILGMLYRSGKKTI